MKLEKKTREKILRKRLLAWDAENPRQISALAESLGMKDRQILSGFKNGRSLSLKWLEKLEQFFGENPSESVEKVDDFVNESMLLEIADQLRTRASRMSDGAVDPWLRMKGFEDDIKWYVQRFKLLDETYFRRRP